MSKKSFKKQVHGADKFFSNNDTNGAPISTLEKDVSSDTATSAIIVASPPLLKKRGEYAEQINIRVDEETKKHLSDKAWEMHMHAADYIRAVIQADMNGYLVISATTVSRQTKHKINIRVDSIMKKYIQTKAWEMRMSVNEYVCNLIRVCDILPPPTH